MPKQALFYKKLGNNVVQCQLCPHHCTLYIDEIGKCGVRQNINGKIKSLVYGKPCSLNLDPIEKKPLYHFLPGQDALSIATVGCNLQCKNCQNWEISQIKKEDTEKIDKFSFNIKPEQVISKAKETNTKIISYTYTEPTIFYEYMLEIAKLAQAEGIKNTTVTNGFINPKPLKELCKYLDGSNIDLKSLSDEFYKKICGARVEPVLKAIKIMKQEGVWIELTNLLIPGLNDSLYSIRKIISWILNNLGADVPLHFTAFYPCYKLTDRQPTSLETLKKARKTAMNVGMNYVYTGNLPDEEGNNTYCPKCNKTLIRRNGFNIIENKLKRGRCSCGQKIPGVWQ